MTNMLIKEWLGRCFVGLAVLCLAGIAASAEQPSITAIRGSKLFLYDGPTGMVVERRDVKSLGSPLHIEVTGEASNGRYPVAIDGKAFWVGKAQVKESNFADNDIKANCQNLTKSFASSRGLGNCN